MRLGSFQYPQLVGFGKIIEIPIAHKIGVEPWQFALTIAIFSLVMHLVIISEFRKIELIINKKWFVKLPRISFLYSTLRAAPIAAFYRLLIANAKCRWQNCAFLPCRMRFRWMAGR